MQMRVEGAAGAGLAANKFAGGVAALPDAAEEIAALLGWWKLAGADTPVRDVPRPWLGAETPVTRTPAPTTPTAIAAAPDVPTERGDPAWASIETLAALRAAVLDQRPGAPFADGDPQSGLMILGEAPSADDLVSGRPFSGPAGRFLDRMLASIGIDRSRCYIGLLCPRRQVAGPPPPEAIAADLPLTLAHIRLVAPRLVVLLGAKPTQALTGETAPIGRIRGQWLTVGDGIPALATFNPAYLLRRPEEKARAWADLLTLRQRLDQ